MPRQCPGVPLSSLEQKNLKDLVKDAVNRAKEAKGLPHTARTALLAPEGKQQEPFTRPKNRQRKPNAPAGLLAPESRIQTLNNTNADQARLQQPSGIKNQQNLETKPNQTVDHQTAMSDWKRKYFPAGGEVGSGFSRQVPPPGTSAPTPPRIDNPNIIITPADGMGTADIMVTNEPKIIGPHPSTIRVSAPYITQSAVEKRLQPPGLDAQERSIAEAREDGFRLQGVTWLDNVRRALQLPIKTYTTACVYYHKFRLAHPTSEYSWTDAAAASLITSCKNEDTLKKSKDILAAAHNLKVSSSHEQVSADDSMFDLPSRAVVGVERLVLESGAFDFRSRSPHQALVKISKSLPPSDDLKGVAQLAWTIMTDLHRTFAPLKQTSATLSLASLELAAHFKATASGNNTCTVRDDLQALDLKKWFTTREEVMETLLDALDLYTHHTNSTILGPKYSLDDFLRIRLALNKECSEAHLPRYTVVQPPPSPDNTNGNGNTLRVANGHPTPVSPPQPGAQAPTQNPSAVRPHQATPEDGGTLRFMLNPQRAVDEKAEVNRYYVEEWEEYEEEVRVPEPSRNISSERHGLPDRPDRGRDTRSREFDDRRSARPDREAPRMPAAAERERLREREREAERERTRLRDRDRDRRYDDRRYDDRTGGGGDRRYDDRRDRGDRRHYEDDSRRGGGGSARDTRR